MLKSIPFTSLILLATVLTAGAQTNKATNDRKIEFRIEAGLNVQSFYGKDDFGNKLHHSTKTGFRSGVTVSYPVAQRMYIQSGLFYSQKGSRMKFDGGGAADYNISYLELPVHFLYKQNLGKGKLVVGAGPYLGYGLSGNVTAPGSFDHKIVFTNRVENSNDYGSSFFVKRFDIGADLLVGYEWKRFSFLVVAQRGFNQLNPPITNYPEYPYVIKNRGFSFNIAYRFSKM